MKVKHVLASLALASVTAFGLVAGLSAKKEAKVVRADTDTWMINISLDLDPIQKYDGFDPNSVWVQTYTDGVGNSKWFQMYPLKSGSEFFQVNATFPEDYSYNRVQFKYTESAGEKYSTPYSSSGSKESHSIQIYCTFTTTWSGDNWNIYLYTSPNLYVKYNNINYYMQPDIANKRFVATDVVSDESDYYTLLYRQSWDFAEITLTDQARNHFSYIYETWNSMRAGTYDVILKNDNSDNGVLDVIKHESPVESYIYYVLENNTPTNDYIYAWGGEEQFGSWPGTQITSVTGVQEVSGNGVIHFQGSETPKLIYKIPVTKGAPEGDVYFKFNNNDNWQSEQRVIELGSAYWYTGPANADAGAAISFLVAAEAIRNAAEDYSVCNVSAEDAETLVAAYNSQSASVRETYIDETTVYTWTTKEVGELAPKGLVSYRAVLEQLANKCKVPLVGSSLYDRNQTLASDNSVVLLTVMFSSVAVVGLITLVILKKKRAR